MKFNSLLFSGERKDERDILTENKMPPFFTDLNLDQVVQSVISGKEQYNLRPFFYTGPVDLKTIDYRQQVFRDLESEPLLKQVRLFAEKMQHTRDQLAGLEKIHYKYQKERFFLDVVDIYREAVVRLSEDLKVTRPESEGLCVFSVYLENYINSAGFVSLSKEIQEITSELSTIQYNILIDGLRVKVTKFREEPDYSAEVERTFEKFKQGEVKNYLSKLKRSNLLNDVEAQVLDGVAQLFPGCFSRLNRFFENNTGFMDDLVVVFDREVQFYISFLDHLKKFRESGLKFCYPVISSSKQDVFSKEGFDLALASNLHSEEKQVVTNDFYLRGNERMFVVSGPNQGGKTTFARTFAQLHFLAGIGCPVPGSDAKLFLFDQLFTHFEREENLKNLRGKLLDELVRIHDIVKQVTPHSLVIINEIFTSTTLQDQVFLSNKMMEKMDSLDLIGVWVTFIDELSSYSKKTVSMVSTVVPENPALRTFKIIRQPADGLAYAISVAEKYGLTHTSLNERFGQASAKPGLSGQYQAEKLNTKVKD